MITLISSIIKLWFLWVLFLLGAPIWFGIGEIVLNLVFRVLNMNM